MFGPDDWNLATEEKESVKEALNLARIAQERNEKQEDREEGEDEETFVGTGSYTFFDHEELEELDNSASLASSSHISVTVERKVAASTKKEMQEDDGVVQQSSLMNFMSEGKDPSYKEQEERFIGEHGNWSEVAVQEALKRLNVELANQDMAANLTKFKDSLMRRRLDEAR